MEPRTVVGVRIAACLMGAMTLSGLSANAADSGGEPESATAASPISTVLMKSVRAATFEVVQKKPEPEADPLKYEKPLPLELIPYAQRNDKYESIGTAFAIGPGSFVTAAHVAIAASGSLWGVPALRDSQGNVYPIDWVTRFSFHEDFMVFTVSGDPRITPLPTSNDYQFDTPVMAVGNALGQGIVGRDGTLTSETPEDQDGRWNWLRFSAAASPGNSGGPLLDAKGRVIGLISRKSPNENLNFALPIGRVLNAPMNKASIDSRYVLVLPLMNIREPVKLEAEFELPLSFPDFERKFLGTVNKQDDDARGKLLQKSATDIYPRGKSSRMLAETYLGQNPGFIAQQTDGSWDVPRNNNAGRTTTLGTDGSVWTNAQAGVTVFRIRYPINLDAAKVRGDGKLLGEQLMNGRVLSRMVAGQAINVTSLGDAGKPEEIRDDLGRLWQQWRWPMPASNSTYIVAALPVPNGYVGFARIANGYSRDTAAAEMRAMMKFMQTPYVGVLPQWRAFLADAHLLPDSFGHWKAALDPAGEVSLELPRLSMKVDKSVLNISERSVLTVVPGILMDGDRPVWDVLGVNLRLEPRSGAASIAATRRARPEPEAGQATVGSWENLTQLRGQFAGTPIRDANNFWINRIVAPENTPPNDAAFVYQLTYGTNKIEVQGEVPRAGELLPQMFHVNEK